MKRSENRVKGALSYRRAVTRLATEGGRVGAAFWTERQRLRERERERRSRR